MRCPDPSSLGCANTLKRCLLFVAERTALVLGLLILPTAFVVLAGIAGKLWLRDETWTIVAVWILFAAGVGTVVWGYRRLRRRTHAWRFAYDTAIWRRTQAKRAAEPQRARAKLLALRIGLCAPSAVATLVLFFLPVAIHLCYPRSQYLPHFHIPIPWTAIGCRWTWYELSHAQAYLGGGLAQRFGFSPAPYSLRSEMWFDEQPRSSGYLGGDVYDGFHYGDPPHSVVRSDFVPGRVPLECRELMLSGQGGRVRIECASLAQARWRLSASFHGVAADVPEFFRIVHGIAPVD
jgi:hypothetical protein